MEQKKIDAQYRGQLDSLIEKLEGFIRTEQYHRILETIIYCIKMIEEGALENNDIKFSEELSLILDACKQLVWVAEEFFYSQRLGAILFKLVEALRNQAALSGQKSVMDFIEDCLPYTIDSLIPYKTLCNHECGSVEDFFPAHLPNPYHLLNEIHTDCLRKAQSNLERYIETAIVTRVVDYWRTLFNISNESGDIQPLIELGEDLLSRIKECSDTKRKKVLWKMVLLLQMLLRDHPAVKTLKSQDWPAEGFVQSLLPFEHQSSTLAQQSFNKQPTTLLKDYRPQLQASRVLFDAVAQGKANVFKAQENHSRQVIKMLEEMVLATRKLLGQSPCEIVVCILGSTSRHDRRPYSDLEYMILHREVPVDKKQDLDLYICHFISIFEMMIVSLGETSSNHNNNKNGFKIDQSLLGLTVSFKSKSWGTPEEVAKKYVIELNEPPHGWLDKGLFEYLHPIALECPELGSRALFEQYTKELDGYLNQVIREEDSPHAITSRFKIPKEDWWKELTRRQGIALASLCEVVHSNENMYLDIKAGRKVNLKTLYYKPLLYCALSLGMYQSCQALTPSKTIKAYCARMPWGGEALLLWWQSALRYVVKEQVKQHLVGGCQHDLMIVSEDACWAGFDLIVEGFILPLQKGVRECLSGSLPISMLSYALLKNYLNARKAWLEKWEEKGLTRSELLSHPLMQVLSSYPDDSGWSPQMELILKQHLQALENLSQLNPPTRCQFSGLPTTQKLCYLSDNLVNSCFESSGKFKGEERWSGENSHLRRVIGGDQRSWFIKEKENHIQKNKEKKQITGLMAREYAAMMLHLLLGGEKQIALGWPIKLGYTDNNIPIPTYVWISARIPGPTMAKVMRKFPEKLSKKNVDMHCFSQLFLFCFLTCPEDGQPENFKVNEIDGKTHLVAFDYGQCFVQAEHTNKPLFGKDTQVLTVKTMIYLLESMDELLSNDLITRIRLLNIEKWFEQWKQSLRDINKVFKPLLEQDLSANSQEEREKYTRFIDLDDGALDCIKTRLELFQHWLRTTQKPITGNNALMDLEPVLALQYASLQGKIKTPEDFYTRLDAKAYKPNAKGKMVSSTSYAQIKERTITPEHIQRSCQLEPRYFNRIDFHQLNDEQQQFALRLLEAAVQQYGERFFKINLSGCKILTKKRLFNLLTRLPRLEELDLRDCEQIQALTLCEIFAQRLNVGFLSGNYDLLCPILKQVKIRIKGKEYFIALNLTLIERKRLSQSMKVFIQWHQMYLQKIIDDLARRNDDDFEKNYNPRMLYSLDYWDENIRSALLKAAERGIFPIRLSALETLGRLGHWDKEIQAVLLRAVNAQNNRMTETALQSLSDLGHWDEEIQEVILEEMKDDAVLGKALVAFSKLGHWDERVRVFLLKGAMDGGRKDVCKDALYAIGSLGFWDKEIRAALLEGANNSEVRAEAIKALRKFGRWDKAIRAALINGAESIAVCKEALIALGEFGRWDNEIGDVLVEAAKFRDYDVRGQGITGLAKLVFKAATGDYGGSGVRESAIVALGNLGHSDEKICGGLCKAIQDKEDSVRIAAVEAIRKLGLEAKFREMLLGAVKDQKDSTREYAVQALGNLNYWDRDIRDALLKAATDHEPSVCKAAVKALGKLNHWDADIRAVLISSAKSRDEWMSKVAVDALGKFGYWDVDIQAVLISVTKSIEEYVCFAALRAIGKLGHWDADIRAVLLSSTKSRKEIVCRGALEALGKLGRWDEEIRGALLKAVGHKDHSVSQAALEALANLGHWDENIGSVVAKTVTKRERLPDVGILYSPLGCMRYLIQQIQSIQAYVESPINNPEDNKIIKRIFFFADPQSQKVLPQVCRKWRDLYAEFREESVMGSIPESRLALPNGRQTNSSNNLSFFGKSSLSVVRVSHVDSLESFELNKAALASQRAIIVCESEGVSARCRVVPAEPDGDCGFTGTRSVLALVGRTDIDWQISRAQFISLVRNEFEKEHSSCKPIILQIFKTDGIMKDDLNEALEQWCKIFIRKGYWMQEAHFRFLSWVFNLEFCFYCVDNDKNILLPELGNESIYEGRDQEAKIVVNLLHMTVTLRDENTQLNHFDGLIISPTLEQEQKINLLLKEGVLEEPEISETEGSQYSQAENKSIGL